MELVKCQHTHDLATVNYLLVSGLGGLVYLLVLLYYTYPYQYILSIYTGNSSQEYFVLIKTKMLP